MWDQGALEKVREIAHRVASSEGMEVVEVEFRGQGPRSLLRIFIDKPGGITHGDCELISNQVGAILDVEDLIPSSYVLQVSSPGVERRLTRPADYARFAGCKVRVVLRAPLGGHRRLVGRLEGLQSGILTLTLAPGNRVSVEYDNVERTNLVFEWKS